LWDKSEKIDGESLIGVEVAVVCAYDRISLAV
jgi:hypothetical protein